jgi:hypothetical protein
MINLLHSRKTVAAAGAALAMKSPIQDLDCRPYFL